MSFLDVEDKVFFIVGIANKKSVAFHIAKTLIENGAKIIVSAQNEKNLNSIKKLLPDAPSFILDVEKETDLERLPNEILKYSDQLNGVVHSIAFANFSDGPKPFHKTLRRDFLQACQISAFSLVEICNNLENIMAENSSVITISISNTNATSYGYLGPIKAMLETTVKYLAKSFAYKNIRFNSIGAGPLKTSASAGIPNYIENYLYSEALTLRKSSLNTQEVANTAAYLLSSKSSGINAENVIIDAGMNCNYFDQEIVKTYSTKNL